MISLKSKSLVGAPEQTEQVSIGTVVLGVMTMAAFGAVVYAIGRERGSAELAQCKRYLEICKTGQDQIYRAFKAAKR